jgi:hypothetical protein
MRRECGQHGRIVRMGKQRQRRLTRHCA